MIIINLMVKAQNTARDAERVRARNGPRLTWESSTDVQDRLAGELAIDKPAGDCADLAPWRLDRDLRPQLLCGDQIGEQSEADTGPLDAHQFVEQGKPVEPHPSGRKKITAFEGRASGLGNPEGHAGAARLQHPERRIKRGAAERVEDQPERPVRLGDGEFAAEHNPFAAPFDNGGAILLAAHMTPDLRAGRPGELAGEMPDPTRGAVDQHLAPEQQPAPAQRVQCGEARDRQSRRLGIPDRIRQRGDRNACGN